MSSEHHFTFEELQVLKSAESKKLKDVYYHYWQNKTVAGEYFEFVDRIELHFEGGIRMVLFASEDVEGAMHVDFDFDAEKRKLLLLHEFGGKIDQRTEHMNTNGLWEPAIGKVTTSVGVVKEKNNQYRNDAILFKFENEELEVRTNVEGLLVEPFENID
jgi:hypothetical protein